MSLRVKVGLLGGTFDPIHNGHLKLARVALRRHRLDRIYFIPCGRPPHKDGRALGPFLHRYTMVALACSGELRFTPSLLEAGPDLSGRFRFYSVDTVARVRRHLGGNAQLYFLLGADQFCDLPTWKDFRRLLRLCDFIVATRPGFSLAEARRVLPPEVLAPGGQSSRRAIHLRRTTVHLLRGVNMDISATAIRRLVRARRNPAAWRKWVPPRVADYIEQMGLYR